MSSKFLPGHCASCALFAVMIPRTDPKVVARVIASVLLMLRTVVIAAVSLDTEKHTDHQVEVTASLQCVVSVGASSDKC